MPKAEKGLPYLVEGKERFLTDEDWDILIVLDACRYDYFEKVYQKYLDGDVKKAVSPATRTMQWLERMFTEKYDDVFYISANPFVNSKKEMEREGCYFDAKEHFDVIDDVWVHGWSDELQTVPAEEVNKAFLKKMWRKKRFILHYIQPHYPYMGKKYRTYIKESYKRSKRLPSADEAKKMGLKKRTKLLLAKGIKKFLGEPTLWKLRSFLNKDSEPQIALIYSKEGWEGIRKAYTENLELVLESVKEIVEKSEGNILITADHGEFLGEGRKFGHTYDKRKKENTEVPWLMIKGRGKGKKKEERVQKKENASDDEQRMKERLAALGYM
jgi:hypothetical protein